MTYHTPFAMVSLKLAGVSTVSSTEDSGLAGAAVAKVKEQRRSANGSRVTILSSSMVLSGQCTAWSMLGVRERKGYGGRRGRCQVRIDYNRRQRVLYQYRHGRDGQGMFVCHLFISSCTAHHSSPNRFRELIIHGRRSHRLQSVQA